MTSGGESAHAVRILSFERFVACVAEHLSTEGLQLVPNATLNELGIDSLSLMELRLTIEELCTSIDSAEISAASTLHGLYNMYAQRVVQSTAGVARNEKVETVGADVITVPPSLRGRLVRLRPVHPDDLPVHYVLATNEAHGFQWRFRGAVPSYEGFVEAFNGGVLTQFSVCDRESTVVGLAVAYGADLRNSFASIGCVVAPHLVGTGAGAEAALLLIRHLFAAWDFRKVYAETTPLSLGYFTKALDDLFIVEGRRRDHYYFNGRYWDSLTLALYRAAWEKANNGIWARL